MIRLMRAGRSVALGVAVALTIGGVAVASPVSRAAADINQVRGRTIQEQKLAGESGAIVGHAMGPAPSFDQWYLGADGIVGEEHPDGTMPTFSIGGRAAASGPTAVGIVGDGEFVDIADRGDDSVRQSTAFGSTTRIPLDATPTGISGGEGPTPVIVTTDVSELFVIGDGTATPVHLDTVIPGSSSGMQVTEYGEYDVGVIVPGNPDLWHLDLDGPSGALQVTKIPLPDGATPVQIIQDGNSNWDVALALSDGDIESLDADGTVERRWTNPQPGATIEQITGWPTELWFRETVDGQSSVGYVDTHEWRVVEAHPVSEERAVSISFVGDTWIAWQGTGDPATSELEDLNFTGMVEHFPVPERAGSDFGPVSVDSGDVAQPEFGTADGYVGLVNEATVTRTAGDDRFTTNEAEAEAAYPSGTSTVFVASAVTAADALAAGPAAAKLGAPVLITSPTSLTGSVDHAIAQLGATKVVIVGGPSAIGTNVEHQLDAIVGASNVTRLGGADRVATSEIVARYAFGAGGATRAVVVTGWSFPDALTAGAAIGSAGPVLLVNGVTGEVGADTASTLASLGVRDVTIAGGPAAVPDSVESSLATEFHVDRIGGATRYETADALAVAFHPIATNALLATGADFADSLGGAAWAAHAGVPLFLAPGDCVTGETLADMGEVETPMVTILGGTDTLGLQVDLLSTCSPPTWQIPTPN